MWEEKKENIHGTGNSVQQAASTVLPLQTHSQFVCLSWLLNSKLIIASVCAVKQLEGQKLLTS